MRNFKRILAIVLVVMMVVPMMATGLSAATAENTYVYSNTGTEVAGGNWKAFVTCDFSGAYGPDFALYDYNGLVTVDSEGQMVLYNTIQKDFAGTPFVTPAARNVLQSTNTTAIDDLFMQFGFMPSGNNGAYPVNFSIAFSETQLQGSLTADSYTVENGFAVEDNGMVKDGLVINMYTTSVPANADPSYEVITAYVMENGKVISSQSFDIDNQGKDFGLTVGHPMRTFFTFDDAGVLTYHVEDTYSADGAYINQTYTFDELDMSSINATEKMYYMSIGSGDYWNAASSAGVNINLARVGTVIDDGDGTFSVEGETKNLADWTGFGVASCEHVWGEYVEVSAPTCTDAGLLEAACQNGCGATDVKTVAALGHAWSDWANTVEPTCTDAGTRARSCGNCGETQTDVAAALGHSWGAWYTTVEPECEYVGLEQRDCSVCGSYEENVIPALGHTWVWDTIPTYDVNGARHCETCATVESDLVYDVSYYWDLASKNTASAIDEGYAEYDDEFAYEVDGYIALSDLSLAYGGEYNYNTLLKATSEFATEISGFSATVENVVEGYEGTALEGQYPTVLSFMWTTEQDNYDDASEFSTSVPASQVGCSGTAESSRYGHLWNHYIAGKEYSVNIVLSDGCLFWGSTWYGELDDGEYDWIYYAVISGGNFWNLKMIQPTTPINAREPITVSVFQEMDFAANKLGLFGDVNGFLFDFGDLAGSQTADKNYYFSVAAYGDGMNAATASFKLTDVCGQAPDLFTGFEHECYDIDPDTAEVAPSCFDDGAHLCAVCKDVLEVVPAIGEHSWVDADCTTPKTCSVCGETEGEALGHSFENYVCTVCGALEGKAYIEGGAAYATLQDAIDAAVAGDKIVLLAKQESGPYTVPAQKNIKIDINGFNIRNKSGDALIVDGANVELYGTNGGTVRSSDGVAIVVMNSGYVTICDAITVRCSTDLEEYNVFSLDETSGASIIALGGRYYKDPTACGVELAPGLAIGGEGTSLTVIEAPVECAHEWGEWVVTVEPAIGVEGSQERTCTLCGEVETESIPALEEPVVEKDYVITFDPDGGVMPEGALLELPINYNENYKEAAGYDYPVPTLEVGYVFAGWYWEAYNYTLYKGDWDTGYYAVQQSITLVALYEECAHANFGEWATTVEPTYDAEGEKSRTCADCGYVETEAIAKLERPWVITFDPDGGVMPEGVPTEMRIATNENYKEATGYDYPVPTLEGGYVFAGWYWELYNFVLDEGTWNGGYFAVAMNVDLVALYEECAHANMSEWTVTVEPQVGVAGEQTATCLDCGYVVVEEIPALEAPAKDYVITFDPDGGVMPEGALLELPINYNENYKEAAGYDYPVPTAPEVGLVFEAWYWEAYNYMLYPGDWNSGYYAVQQSITLVAIYVECPHANMSEWTVTVEPQVGVAGEQTATCLDCGYVAVEEIPALDPPAKAYTITFDPDGGVMPEGALLVLPIDYMDNYKEAAGYDYPVPTLDGYKFAGWYWELYNFTLTEGDWNGGYYAVQMSIDVVALWEEAPVVAVVADGNTITVTNVDSTVKDIFVAAGKQEVYKDVKANMLYHLYATSHKVVDGTWSYDVSENGTYTVLIRYNDGTVEAKYFVVDCNDGTVADCVQDGATVTFNNLNDLYVLRYVAGEYDSSYAIKRAPGVVNVSPKYNADQFVNGSFSVTLEPGVYSFVTQFNDGNYVYYTITVEAPKKDYKITFNPDGGVMPEGVALEYGINYMENYKEATGIEYPVPTLEGYTFDGWYWEAFNYWLTEGDWNGGWFAVQQDVDLIALWLEA